MPQTFWIMMGIALRHDRLLMPQEPLDVIQVYPGLYHPCRERMAKIVEMKIFDLRDIERSGQSSPDIAPIERRVGVTVEHDVSRPWPRRVFIFQEIKNGGVHRDRPSLSVLRLLHHALFQNQQILKVRRYDIFFVRRILGEFSARSTIFSTNGFTAVVINSFKCCAPLKLRQVA